MIRSSCIRTGIGSSEGDPRSRELLISLLGLDEDGHVVQHLFGSEVLEIVSSKMITIVHRRNSSTCEMEMRNDDNDCKLVR